MMKMKTTKFKAKEKQDNHNDCKMGQFIQVNGKLPKWIENHLLYNFNY